MDEQKLTGWQITWLLIKAPLLGALFCMFLPFIGIAMIAWYGAKTLWEQGVKAERNVVTWYHRHHHA